MNEEVKTIIDQIKPMLRADGGDVELLGVADGVVKVRLTGACGSCAMSSITLKMGIERLLKDKIPEIKEVVSV